MGEICSPGVRDALLAPGGGFGSAGWGAELFVSSPGFSRSEVKEKTT